MSSAHGAWLRRVVVEDVLLGGGGGGGAGCLRNRPKAVLLGRADRGRASALEVVVGLR